MIRKKRPKTFASTTSAKTQSRLLLRPYSVLACKSSGTDHPFNIRFLCSQSPYNLYSNNNNKSFLTIIYLWKVWHISGFLNIQLRFNTQICSWDSISNNTNSNSKSNNKNNNKMCHHCL